MVAGAVVGWGRWFFSRAVPVVFAGIAILAAGGIRGSRGGNIDGYGKLIGEAALGVGCLRIDIPLCAACHIGGERKVAVGIDGGGLIAENTGDGDGSACRVRAADVSVEYVPVSVLFPLSEAVDRRRSVLRLRISFA